MSSSLLPHDASSLLAPPVRRRRRPAAAHLLLQRLSRATSSPSPMEVITLRAMPQHAATGPTPLNVGSPWRTGDKEASEGDEGGAASPARPVDSSMGKHLLFHIPSLTSLSLFLSVQDLHSWWRSTGGRQWCRRRHPQLASSCSSTAGLWVRVLVTRRPPYLAAPPLLWPPDLDQARALPLAPELCSTRRCAGIAQPQRTTRKSSRPELPPICLCQPANVSPTTSFISLRLGDQQEKHDCRCTAGEVESMVEAPDRWLAHASAAPHLHPLLHSNGEVRALLKASEGNLSHFLMILEGRMDISSLYMFAFATSKDPVEFDPSLC